MLLLAVVLAPLLAEERRVPRPGGDELTVTVHEPDAGTNQAGEAWRIVWLTPQYGAQAGHREIVIPGLTERGVEVWQVDLLADLFLPRTSRSVRGLDGRAVAALLQAAAAEGDDRRLLLVAAERLALTALRGLRHWQRSGEAERLGGAVLLYPNLYTGTPVAGEPPVLAPITQAIRLPVMILQPEQGTHTHRLDDLLATLQGHGAPAFAWLIPGRSDWYDAFLDAPTSADRAAARELPQLLLQSGRLLRTAVPDPLPRVAELPSMDAPPKTAGLVERPRRPAPALRLEAASGATVDLDDYRGQVILVNFWASWCPPCVEEIPSMNRLQARFEAEDFVIVSVNYKESTETITDFLENITVDFPVLLDTDGRYAQEWNVFAFPSSFLVDRNGHIRYSANKAIAWDTEPVVETIRTIAAEPGGRPPDAP